MATAAKITSDITMDGVTVLCIDGEPVGAFQPVAHRASGRVAWSGRSMDGKIRMTEFLGAPVKAGPLRHALGEPVQRAQS